MLSSSRYVEAVVPICQATNPRRARRRKEGVGYSEKGRKRREITHMYSHLVPGLYHFDNFGLKAPTRREGNRPRTEAEPAGTAQLIVVMGS